MLDQILRVIETADVEVADGSERIKEHKLRKEQLELAASEARKVLAERRQLLDSANCPC